MSEISRKFIQDSTHLITVSDFAYDSPDYHNPWGTRRDNSKSPEFWTGLIKTLGKQKISLLDLGCAGGGLVAEGAEMGHDTIGIEGSNYWVKNINENSLSAIQWKYFHNRRLFTCDITMPFFIIDVKHELDPIQDKILPIVTKKRFDVITAWEVLEHLNPTRFQIALGNIWNHLADDGIFLASIGMTSDSPEGVELHQIIQPVDWWLEQFTKFNLFDVFQYPINDITPVRLLDNSIYVFLRKKKNG